MRHTNYMELTDEQFDQLISQAMDELPQEYIVGLDNVAVTYADAPTAEQLKKQGVGRGEVLLGLYEGIPRVARGSGYNLVLPDKITLFKLPILAVSQNESDLFEQIKRTLWHEIAHHYGLGHDRIHELENRWKKAG